MSQNSTQNPLPAIDRTLPFAMQMTPLAEVMLEFFNSKRTKLTIPITFDVHGVPAFTFSGSIPSKPEHLRTYTRTELREILATSVELVCCEQGRKRGTDSQSLGTCDGVGSWSIEAHCKCEPQGNRHQGRRCVVRTRCCR